jgi:hypothetical protein
VFVATVGCTTKKANDNSIDLDELQKWQSEQEEFCEYCMEPIEEEKPKQKPKRRK